MLCPDKEKVVVQFPPLPLVELVSRYVLQVIDFWDPSSYPWVFVTQGYSDASANPVTILEQVPLKIYQSSTTTTIAKNSNSTFNISSSGISEFYAVIVNVKWSSDFTYIWISNKLTSSLTDTHLYAYCGGEVYRTLGNLSNATLSLTASSGSLKLTNKNTGTAAKILGYTVIGY